ncbi:MAG: methylmalonyl-CoA epimerase [Acidobacteriota bacterium]|nr:methylmalonyl-CoA epimerase [Blastocatellia bacterium]MDW8239969.1 methylmalonyl-CoA epimerase [Acidobacteriota bacterium]
MNIDHIGIAVRSLDESLKFYQDALGLHLHETEVVEEQKVRAALLPVGSSRIELLEATSDESPIAKFMAKRGEGIHHICFEVDDIEAHLERLKAAGARLIDETPRRGVGGHKIAFIHPTSAHGVLIELVEKVS